MGGSEGEAAGEKRRAARKLVMRVVVRERPSVAAGRVVFIAGAGDVTAEVVVVEAGCG